MEHLTQKCAWAYMNICYIFSSIMLIRYIYICIYSYIALKGCLYSTRPMSRRILSITMVAANILLPQHLNEKVCMYVRRGLSVVCMCVQVCNDLCANGVRLHLKCEGWLASPLALLWGSH